MTMIRRILNISLLFISLSPLLHQPSVAFQVKDEDSSLPYHTYRLYSAEEIGSTLLDWQRLYPDLIRVTTSQQEFDLPTAGDSWDCPFDATVAGCLNYYAVVQDYVTHPEGSASSNRLPTVLLSGALHGDERVGPTAVMEATRVLLEAATCESYPRFTTNSTQFNIDQTQAIQCQDQLQRVYGITPTQQQWLARLVNTRRILVVPTANALGYDRNSRLEESDDPNRDFPYDQLDPTLCMRTIAARTLNELFRKYLITNSFTFHGGTELLGYEWGNPSWYGKVSPDDIAQDQLAQGYVQYGGAFQGSNGDLHPYYEYGDMNSIIYYVRGGFEDYAYAGSWDKKHILACTPTTYGGYDTQKTIYEDGMLRSFNMLVETSWSKEPSENDLGTTQNLLYENSDNNGKDQQRRRQTRNLRGTYSASVIPRLSASQRIPNGHIPRNLRLSIASIDLVQPYLRVTAVNDVTLADDLVPLTESTHKHNACAHRTFVRDAADRLIEQAIETGAVPVVSAPLQSNPTLQWSVGGAMNIDETSLWVAVLANDTVQAPNGVAWLTSYICGNPILTITSYAKRLEANEIQNSFIPIGSNLQGNGFFSDSNQPTTMGPVFSATLDLAALNVTQQTTFIVLAGAKVDSEWTRLPNEAVGPANTNPQSHMVQARTNDTWFFENTGGFVIQGQSTWFSNPILLHLVDDAHNSKGTQHHNDRTQDPSKRPAITTIGKEATTGSPTAAPAEEFLPTQAPTEEDTSAGASDDLYIADTVVPSTEESWGPVTMDPSYDPTIAPIQQLLPPQFQKRVREIPYPGQSLADIFRMVDQLIKEEETALELMDGGGRQRHAMEIQQPTTPIPPRAKRKSLEELPPRP
jgi:Zinc carboxypeptidase